MKILHVSGLAGNLNHLSTLEANLKTRSDITTVIFSGNLIGGGLIEREDFEKSMMAWHYLNSVLASLTFIKPRDYIEQVRAKLENFEDAEANLECNGLRDAFGDYIKIQGRFDSAVTAFYHQIFGYMKDIAKKVRVLCIPGTWDCSHYEKRFEEFDLHEKTVEIAGVRIAGFGNLGVNEAGTLITRINEDRFNPHLERKAYEFFELQEADVNVASVPPFGFFENHPRADKVGSPLMALFIERNFPALYLCGHHGTNFGATQYKNKTFIVNSEGFNKEPGRFMEIELSGRRGGVKVERIVHYLIEGQEIRPNFAQSFTLV